MSILTEAPEGAKVLDLEAGRAARAEQRAKDGQGNPYLKLAAGYVEVKAEFALSTAFDFKNEDIEGGLRGLLADPADLEAVLADGLTAQDLEALTKFVTGATLGESLASPKP